MSLGTFWCVWSDRLFVRLSPVDYTDLEVEPLELGGCRCSAKFSTAQQRVGTMVTKLPFCSVQHNDLNPTCTDWPDDNPSFATASHYGDDVQIFGYWTSFPFMSSWKHTVPTTFHGSVWIIIVLGSEWVSVTTKRQCFRVGTSDMGSVTRHQLPRPPCRGVRPDREQEVGGRRS